MILRSYICLALQFSFKHSKLPPVPEYVTYFRWDYSITLFTLLHSQKLFSQYLLYKLKPLGVFYCRKSVFTYIESCLLNVCFCGDKIMLNNSWQFVAKDFHWLRQLNSFFLIKQIKQFGGIFIWFLLLFLFCTAFSNPCNDVHASSYNTQNPTTWPTNMAVMDYNNQSDLCVHVHQIPDNKYLNLVMQ